MTKEVGEMDNTYADRMQQAIRRAEADYKVIGWYGATESAADDYEVSLPELQRALDKMLLDSEGQTTRPSGR